MRIISGMAGGIRLLSPEGRALRPTEDRVKESMFGTLGDLQGKIVLDLFSGTGALGLEALSRGAAEVYFFEREKAHIDFIKRNLELVRRAIGAKAGLTRVYCMDAQKASAQIDTSRINLILADPPYAADDKEYGAASLLKDDDFAAGFSPECLLVLEHASQRPLPWEEQNNWSMIKEKAFGVRAVAFAKRI